MFDSVTINGLHTALDAYALRQSVIADNVANINTPNYLAKRVVFEEALGKSIAAGRKTSEITETHSLEPTRQNGNNVNLDAETVSHTDTVLRVQFATQAISSKFTGISTALKTQ